MSGDPDLPWWKLRPGDQSTHGSLAVVQVLSHDEISVDQAVGHAVVVLQPVLIVRRDTLCLSPPVLERVRVRRDHSQAPSGERGAKCLQGVPGKPCDFAFSEVECASVLVKHHHAPNRVRSLGNEQERRDLSPVVAFIGDGFPEIFVAVSRRDRSNPLSPAQQAEGDSGGPMVDPYDIPNPTMVRWVLSLQLTLGCQQPWLDNSSARPGANAPASSPGMAGPPAPPVASGSVGAPRSQIGLKLAKRDGKSAVVDFERTERWPPKRRIHSPCPALAPLPRCGSDEPRDAEALFRSEALAVGDSVTVRGTLGLGGGFTTARRCTNQCCNRSNTGVILGTPPLALPLETFVCAGDESRQCCDAPAFGEVVVADGKLQTASFEWNRLYGIKWSLIEVKLCQE